MDNYGIQSCFIFSKTEKKEISCCFFSESDNRRIITEELQQLQLQQLQQQQLQLKQLQQQF
jgi:hypothetical protein